MDENSEKWNSEWNLFSSCQKKKKKTKTQKPEIQENLLQYSAERTYDTLWKQ